VSRANTATDRPPELSRSVSLAFEPASVRVGRRGLSADLEAAGIVEPERSDILILASELLANAIRHARPLPDATIQVMWWVRVDEVEVAVMDGGAGTTPHAEHAPYSALTGRGLRIVESLADRWGVSGAGTGHQIVWAVVARPYHT
jgi:serine/threonine-protein kinase RsbW